MDKNTHSNEEEELHNAAPTLFGLKKEDLKAPEGYFDSFHNRLQDRIAAPEKKGMFARIFERINMKVAVPALITCGLAIGLLFYLNADNNSSSEFQAALMAELEADDTTLRYSDDDLYLIDDEVFADYMQNQDELLAEVLTTDLETPNEEDALINFLLDEGINLEDIVEEL